MKKFIALVLTLVSVLFLLTGCNNQPLILDGRYFQSSPANETRVDETCVYDISVASKTPSNSTEYKNEAVKLEISEGTLTTKLRVLTDDEVKTYGDGYYYESVTKVKGKYVIADVEHPFEDEITAKTYFKKFYEGYAPYKTEKHVKNHTLTANTFYEIADYEYEFTINYGKKAVVDINVIKDYKNRLTYLNGRTEYEYNKGAFIENELLLFVPRSFNLDDSYYQSVKSLDAISKKIHPMQYQTANVEGGIDVKSFTLPNYVYNGTPTVDKQVTATRLTLSLTDVFNGSDIECYYATNQSEMRHLLIKFYTKLNSNLGYLEYTLKEVNFLEH